MKINADSECLLVKKLLHTVKVPYGDIKSIVYSEDCKTTVRTHGKQEYRETSLFGLMDRCSIIYDKILDYNIAFKDERTIEEGEGGIFGEEEKNAYVQKFLDAVREDSIAMIKDRIGPKFSLEFLVKDIHLETSLYTRLLKDDKVISDIPNPMINYPEDGIKDAFDVTLLAYLCEWDPKTKTGKYVVLNEALNAEKAKKYMLEQVDTFCNGFLEVNSREYLEQI
ncbi:MAG: hypothetical protein J5379_05755 [Clostridiales bacterium]|nr:hypothetical protein [Clostridiales bacterium]